ncbi:MAG TPA: hypothetical protein VEU29_03035 [Actinomycetota bacterium]|nr:hypothetical protein [Actinomycetota bacterium]
MRKLCAILATAMAVTSLPLVSFAAPAKPEPVFELHLKRHHRPGAPVIAVLQNVSDERQRIDTPWTITRAKNGEVVAQNHWSKGERWLAPDQTAIWEWDQREGSYSSEPSPPGNEEERVRPGGYVLTVDRHDEALVRRFHIGRFFTLGFEGRDDTFTVFVNERKPIKLMKAEAEAEDKTLVVSGIVRGESRYNREWSYTMGPGSIVLGEVFIEVCDGNPRYVERHKKQWLGERWCPWSSYVAKIGR